MALSISESVRDFWSEINRMNRNTGIRPAHIDGFTDNKEIAEHLANKYEMLLNMVGYEHSNMSKLMSEMSTDIKDSRYDHTVLINEVKDAIKLLKMNKSDGSHGCFSNHFIYASSKLHELFCALFTSSITHGHTPSEMCNATLTSIPKDKCKDICNSDNYRGIALSSALCKISDLIIINRHCNNLKTSNLQYAFQKKHSTVQCSAVFQQMVKHYLDNGSEVYSCVLDASKAFDRVSFYHLFKNLADRGIPAVLMRYIMDGYLNQKIRAR